MVWLFEYQKEKFGSLKEAAHDTPDDDGTCETTGEADKNGVGLSPSEKKETYNKIFKVLEDFGREVE